MKVVTLDGSDESEYGHFRCLNYEKV
jgi:hypothetical protein